MVGVVVIHCDDEPGVGALVTLSETQTLNCHKVPTCAFSTRTQSRNDHLQSLKAQASSPCALPVDLVFFLCCL